MVKDAALREMISGRRLTLIGEGFSQIESVWISSQSLWVMGIVAMSPT